MEERRDYAKLAEEQTRRILRLEEVYDVLSKEFHEHDAWERGYRAEEAVTQADIARSLREIGDKQEVIHAALYGDDGLVHLRSWMCRIAKGAAWVVAAVAATIIFVLQVRSYVRAPTAESAEVGATVRGSSSPAITSPAPRDTRP